MACLMGIDGMRRYCSQLVESFRTYNRQASGGMATGHSVCPAAREFSSDRGATFGASRRDRANQWCTRCLIISSWASAWKTGAGGLATARDQLASHARILKAACLVAPLITAGDGCGGMQDHMMRLSSVRSMAGYIESDR
jgi:hypothetical protein